MVSLILSPAKGEICTGEKIFSQKAHSTKLVLLRSLQNKEKVLFFHHSLSNWSFPKRDQAHIFIPQPCFQIRCFAARSSFFARKVEKSQKQRQMTNLIVDNVILWFIMSEYEQSMIEVRKSSVFPIRAQEGRGRKGQPPKGIRCSCAGYAWDDGEYPAYCHSRCAAQEWGAVRPVFWLSHEQCLLCS